MSTRSHHPPPHLLNEFGEPMHESDVAAPGRCQGASSFVKGVCGFLLSHVGLLTLVVGYCMAGAVIFEKLEREHEEEVKQRMITERVKVTDDLWDITR